ncbi:MAG: TRAP transporter small permease [Actinomycetia bacterium]|nr:TRAP transporter small permease [Actinomycetes bacterium]
MSQHEQPEGATAVAATGLGRCANAIEAFMKPVYTWFGYFSALVLGLLILAMVYSVIGRRFFDSPLQGSGDIIEMSMLLLTFGAMGLEHMGHEKMTVGVLADHLPKRVQAIIEPIIYFLCVAILCMAVWQLIRWGIKIQGRGETTPGTLRLPKYPFAYVAAFGMFTLVPIYVGRLLHAAERLRSPAPAADSAADKGVRE